MTHRKAILFTTQGRPCIFLLITNETKILTGMNFGDISSQIRKDLNWRKLQTNQCQQNVFSKFSPCYAVLAKLLIAIPNWWSFFQHRNTSISVCLANCSISCYWIFRLNIWAIESLDSIFELLNFTFNIWAVLLLI